MSDEDKTCRVCKNKLETLEHIVSECVHRIGDAGDIEKLLNEDASGVTVLKGIVEIRKESEKAKMDGMDG